MTRSKSKTFLWIALGVSSAACGSTPPTSTASGWDCANVDVPNGTTLECTATNASALTASAPLPVSYYCPPDKVDPACPPADAGAGAPSYTYDSGTSNPVTTAGGDTTVTTDAGAPVTTAGDDAGGYYDYDSGTTTDDAGTVGSGGNGNGNGGNPHGGPPGNPSGGGNPHVDSGTTGGEGSSGAGSSGGGSSGGGAGGGCDAGSGGGGDNGGGYTCTTGDDGSPTCTTPPTCAPGNHPSACGACVPDGTTEDCTPPSSGGCWITGGGFIVDGDGNDSFGGNAMPMKSGTIRGQWEHVDHGTTNKMHGEPSYIVCRHVDEPGPGADNGPKHNFTINQAYFGGAARFFTAGAWADGYWFDVMVEDHGEGKGAKAGGPDYYHITIRKMSGQTQSGVVVYDTEANMSGGNIQIHPPNNGHPFTSSALPSWVSLQP